MTNYTQAVNAIRKLRLCPPNKAPQTYIYETLSKKETDAREQGDLIIIGGDFNEPFCPENQYPATAVNMNTIMAKLDLVLATNPNGDLTPPTHSSGNKTLDHIWISSSLLPLLTGYGYLPFNAGFMSDHRGAFIHLHLKHASNPPPVIRERRKLTSKSPDLVVRYLDSVRRMLPRHLLMEKISCLKRKTTFQHGDVETLQLIDEILTEIQLIWKQWATWNPMRHVFEVFV